MFIFAKSSLVLCSIKIILFNIFLCLKDGVIADFDASEKMVGMLIKSVPALKKKLFPPSLRSSMTRMLFLLLMLHPKLKDKPSAKFSLMLDSGASCNFISLEQIRTLALRFNSCTKHSVRLANGGKVETVGSIMLKVKFGGGYVYERYIFLYWIVKCHSYWACSSFRVLNPKSIGDLEVYLLKVETSMCNYTQ